MYLTYVEYQSFGGLLDELPYNRLEFAARMKIDYMTKNRLHGEDPVREAVKRLVFELVERGYCGSLDGKEATSVSEGSLSLSYESNQGKADKLIVEYLLGEEIDDEALITNQGGFGSIRVDRV